MKRDVIETSAFQHNVSEQPEIMIKRISICHPFDLRRHVLDGKHHSREHDRRKHKKKRCEVRLLLALAESRNQRSNRHAGADEIKGSKRQYNKKTLHRNMKDKNRNGKNERQ